MSSEDPQATVPTKRVAKDGSHRSAKTKRARYVASACDVCKRRKVRCDGQMPCDRCYDLDVACSYQRDNRERPRDLQLLDGVNTHMQAIQSKLDMLTHYIATIRPEDFATHAVDELKSRNSRQASDICQRTRSSGILDQPQSLCPGFRGPTSSTFIFEVAKDSVRKKGLRLESIDRTAAIGRESLPPTLPYRQSGWLGEGIRENNTLQRLGQDTVMRLCEAYDASIGIMYPLLNMSQIFRRIRLIFAPTEVITNALAENGSPDPNENDVKFEMNIIRLICAASLAFKSSVERNVAQSLYDEVDMEAPIWDAMGLQGLQYLALAAIYHVQMGQDVRASRIIGVAGRLCLEMGLNRYEVLKRDYPEQHAKDHAMRVFWTVYVLDMRASCGTGIPSSIQEMDVDPTLPEPDSSYALLKTMISFARLSGKVWRLQNSFTSPESKIDDETIELLDYQVMRWHKKMPDCLQYDPSEPQDHVAIRKEPLFARVIARARFNQLRCLIYRPVLYSKSNIEQHMHHAQTVVDIANSTIAMFSSTGPEVAIYNAQPVIFAHFIISALGVLLLAVANSPEMFAGQCCVGYYAALGLLNQSSKQSEVMLRLWKTIESLEGLGPKLGLITSTSGQPLRDIPPDSYQQMQSPATVQSADFVQSVERAIASEYQEEFANLFGFALDAVDSTEPFPSLDTDGDVWK